ncbi:TPA: nucleotidyltransferase domain-containing protein [Vibrio vulnificus]|nr:nucleotidyltransferase domain-containing protein [Vibrio vulnificus]
MSQEILERKTYSEKIVNDIKERLIDIESLGQNNVSVIVTGSFGRNEASKESDMDWFIISEESLDSALEQKLQKDVTQVVNEYVTKNVGNTGTFGGVVTKAELLSNFGGDKETNQEFTRRMLYLLESKPLYNTSLYTSLKEEILKLYIKEGVPDSSLNRFMLNDVIRYYRTICTDYEYKVHEGMKSWGVRKIKLRFSRKLLYFSGLLTVAYTSNLTRDEKVAQTLSLLEYTPIDRIKEIVGQNISEKMVAHYANFLTEISKPEIRDALEGITRENKDECSEYRKLKNLSQHFNWEMEKCFLNEFPSSHPIHGAMLF